MKRVLIYSGLLLGGMAVSQVADLASWRTMIHWVTMACLSYIMVEVGLEFTLDKSRLKQYALDYGVAATAAAFPWIFCAIYFIAVLDTPWKEAWLVGRFAAPTSAGVLFTMLAAAGLSATWVFKKAWVLAIFDDLDTVLLMIPLQVLFVGLKWQLGVVVLIIAGLLVMAYRWLKVLRWPIGKTWLLGYGIAITLICWAVEYVTHIHLEVLLPAFAFGCVLHHSPSIEEGDDPHSALDQAVKAAFMFLVGCSLPRVALQGSGVAAAVGHVAALTVLSNIGKCFPLVTYKDEAGFKERLALSVAMFPRGEVGAGVLLVAIGYGLTGLPAALGGLSLALNLLLTGLFIVVVKKLLHRTTERAGGGSVSRRRAN